ncbi:uncharacterized protein METZ01_LOCUS394555, partial [marine metagenome]
YRADVVMVSADREGTELGRLASQYSSIASIAGINLPKGEDKTATNLATLTSRNFIEQHVVDRAIRPILFEDAWDKNNMVWIGGQEPTAWQTYELVKGNVVTVDTDRRTGLITFAVMWKEPKIAAEWANNMIKDLNNHIRRQAIEEVQKNIFFLEQQLDETSQVNTQKVIYNLIEEQTKNIMLANVREEYAFKIIDPAVVPEMRIKPRRGNILIIGFLIGLFSGCFLVVVKNYYHQNILSSK